MNSVQSSVNSDQLEGKRPLPEGWVWKTLGEIADLVGGGTPSREKPEYFTGDYVWLTPTEIPKNKVAVVSDSRERITDDALHHSSARLIPKGSVLMTSRASIGYVAIAGTEVTTNQGFASFLPKDGVNNFFLAYWLWANASFFIEQATGTTFKEITKSKLRTFSFPLPPLLEQERIVARLEELLSDQEAGVAALERVRAGAKRYKASVLKAACEGKLVLQDQSDEPIEIFLQRVGKSSSAGADLPSLPSGWLWIKISDLFDVSYGLSESLSKTEPDDDIDIPVIRIPNVTEFGSLDLTNLKYFPLDHKKRGNLLLKKGDVLFNWRNAPKWIGRSTVFNKDGEYVNASFLLKLRPSTSGYSEFVAMYLNHLRISGYFMTIVNNAVNQANFNATRTSQVEIPLPPLDEQRRIVAEVERRLESARAVEAAVEAGLKRAARLRQAVLRSAFEGRLS